MNRVVKSIAVLWVSLSLIDLVISNSIKLNRPRRDTKERPIRKGAAFQVPNQPRSGRRSYSPSPQRIVPRPPPSSSNAEVIDLIQDSLPSGKRLTDQKTKPPFPKARSNAKETPLLDFPSSEVPTSPLLDFPDPLELEFQRRGATYENACQSPDSIKRKRKAVEEMRKKNNAKADDAHQVRTQNRRLEQAMMYHFVEKIDIPEHHPINGFKLLDKVVDIFESFCKRKVHLPDGFVTNAMYAFKKLHYLTSSNRTEFIPDGVHTLISSILSTCSNSMTGFRFFQDQCKENIVAWKNQTNWLCTHWEDDLNPGAFDPLLDIFWHIYNTVHWYCKDFFGENFLRWHTFSAEMMDLLSPAMQLRWNLDVAPIEFWNRILGPNFLVHAKNVERCAQAAVESKPAQLFMKRFTTLSSIRYYSIDQEDEGGD